jgi:hypothetical protein
MARLQESHDQAMAALAEAQNLEVAWALGNTVIFLISKRPKNRPADRRDNPWFNQGVSDDDVKAGWSKYKQLVEASMREKSAAQVLQCDSDSCRGK